MRKIWAVALLAGGLAVVIPAPASAAVTEFSSGFESGQPQPTWSNTVESSAGVGGYCCGLTGMESGTRTEAAHTGTAALMYSGADASTTSSYSYNRIFDVDITVGASTTLSYWVFPQSGGNLDVAVDLAFTDGTFLRNSGAVDQHGVRVNPHDQGTGWVLNFDTWNNVTSTIGNNVAGKTIDRILVGYDKPEGHVPRLFRRHPGFRRYGRPALGSRRHQARLELRLGLFAGQHVPRCHGPARVQLLDAGDQRQQRRLALPVQRHHRAGLRDQSPAQPVDR